MGSLDQVKKLINMEDVKLKEFVCMFPALSEKQLNKKMLYMFVFKK